MTSEQTLISAILLVTMALFIWGRFRHDVVALAALLAAVIAGLVPADDAFSGFGHPAVITVACVLILSAGLQNSGAVDILSRAVIPERAGRLASMSALLLLGAALSGFMNNVGAMALLMPVAVQLAGRLELTPGQVLMPLAFGTIMGGMTTLVGTPPNLIVSGFRYDEGFGAFAMFDFAPVGVAVALAGVLLIALLGWRLVPARRPAGDEDFRTAPYMTEVRIGEKDKAAGLTLRAFEREMESADAQVIALVRNEVRMQAPHGGRKLRPGDVLTIEAEVDGLAKALARLDLKLEESASRSGGRDAARDEAAEGDAPSDKDRDGGKRRSPATLREVVVQPGSPVIGRTALGLRLRTRYGINLLGLAREGRRTQARLRSVQLKAGDLLLLQGDPEVLADFTAETDCLPLAERALRIPDRGKAVLAVAIMGLAVALVSFGLLPAAPAFALAVVASIVAGTVPVQKVWAQVDWPVIVLLGAMFPVAKAVQSTGVADLMAIELVQSVAQGGAIGSLMAIMVVTMLMSSIINNAATAAIMAAIALGTARTLEVNPDAFLMAVAIGASCAFLTPIGHQNNTLILGPGGFRFTDYWRLGLPLEALVVAVSVPLLLIVWPL